MAELGEVVGQAALDAIALLYEHEESPQLMAVSVTLVTIEDGEVTACCSTWAAGAE